MAQPLILAVFCLDDIPVKVLDELVDVCRDDLKERENQSLIFIVRNPQQSEFDRGTEKPVAEFSTGFKGTELSDLLKFCETRFVQRSHAWDNITKGGFAALDRRTVDFAGDEERTLILAHNEHGELRSMRVKFTNAALWMNCIMTGQPYIGDIEEAIHERGVYQPGKPRWSNIFKMSGAAPFSKPRSCTSTVLL